MRRDWGGEPCCVPRCYRRSKKEVPFCERCWGLAADEERAGVQIAAHAPYFRAYLSRLDVELVWFDNGERQPPTWVHGYHTIGDEYAGRVLREFEARTTRDAVAALVAARLRAASGSMIPDVEAA